MLVKAFIILVLLGSAFGQFDPHFDADKNGIVHLFEWHWDTIADECETFLAPNNIGGVQVSPPTENLIVSMRPWWERYQPVSYKLETRSGVRDAFVDMVERCNSVSVRIYPDLVINHMTGGGRVGNGTGGSSMNATSEDFPAVPYNSSHFNDQNCGTETGQIENFQDVNQTRLCRLLNLVDLNQKDKYVREKIITMMNDMVEIGVAGFRVDAAKHMYPEDLAEIFGAVKDLRMDVFGSGKRPYIYQEVIDLNASEPIHATDYTGIGSVTEFKYGRDLSANKDQLQVLSDIGESWGMLPGNSSLVFINNHDNQRGHGSGGEIVDFEDPYDLKILTAYMLAWPYGTPRVMSSYYFTDSDQGPPPSQRSIHDNGTCGNGWVCEHRWRPIKNMFGFSVAVKDETISNWWNSTNRIAFSRGNKGFIAINKVGNMKENLKTGLPDGSYCNIIAGDYLNGQCTGPKVEVRDGYANIEISSSVTAEQVVAIHVDAVVNGCVSRGSMLWRMLPLTVICHLIIGLLH